MSTKRDSSHIVDSADDQTEPDAAAGYQPSPKRARDDNVHQHRSNKKQQQEPATNVTYGQRCCFPGIDSSVYNSDEDLEFEDESDALAYLQSVRQEASGIPHLLVAPKSGPQLPPPRQRGTAATTTQEGEIDYDDDEPIDRSIYTDGQSDTRGYYQDGAYTAAPENIHAAPDAEADDDDDNDDKAAAHEIAEAYFASLRTQFQRLRTKLHTPPPAHLVPPSGDHSPHVGPFGPASRTFTIWTTRLLTTDPHPLQLALMDKGSVFRLLRVLLGGGKFLRSGVEVSERTSRWLWALLARLPDRGELDHVEVGHVRELGKRAAVLMHSLQQMALLREEVELGGHGDDGDEEAGEDGVWAADDDEDLEADDPVKKEDDGEQGDTHQNETSAPPDVLANHDNNSSAQAKPEPNVKLEEPDDFEDGEINDDDNDNDSESVPMDMDNEDDMEAAKARLLASLEDAPSSEDESKPSGVNSKPDEGGDGKGKFDPVRARMNMRATLNMILTVAGEFYGQRDLLEFRDPFRGI